MISLKNRFLFIHVPKTGGNSIQNILSRHSDDKIVILNNMQDGKERFEVRYANTQLHKHSSLQDYRIVFGSRINELYKFVTIRNPWDRAISFYFSPHRGEVEWDKKSFLQFVSSNVKPLRHYLQLEANDSFVSNVDFIIKYESLENDFRRVLEIIKVKMELLPHRNKSTRKHYTHYYDSELIDFIHDAFLEDIQLGGYKYK